MPRRKKIETDEERDARVARQVIREAIRDLFASAPPPPRGGVALSLPVLRNLAEPIAPAPRPAAARTAPKPKN
jgi:hypothetical protein